MMEKRGEPFRFLPALLLLVCGPAHRDTASPVLRPERALLAHVLFGPRPWLHLTPSPVCPALFAGFTAVGSEEAPIEGLASVRRSNGTCSFPAFRFHEWLHES